MNPSKSQPVAGHTYAPPSMDVLQEMFNRYDLDRSGTINSIEELSQLTTNMLFYCKMRIHPEAVADKLNGVGTEVNMDIFAYQEWLLTFQDNQGSGFAKEVKEVAAYINTWHEDSPDCINKGSSDTTLKKDTLLKPQAPAPFAVKRVCFKVVPYQAARQLCDALPDMVNLSLYFAIVSWSDNFRSLEKSLGCFSHTNSVRVSCKAMIRSNWWDVVVNVMIFCCIISMTINCPLWFPHRSAGWWVFWVLDLGFTIFFTVELGIRMIANSVLFGKTAELRSAWGKLDTLIVVTSWLSLLEGLPDIKGARALRMLRSLKSMRTLRSGRWFSTTLGALEIAMVGLRDVLMAGTFFLLLYSLVGLSLFSGILDQRCVESGSLKPLEPPAWCGSDRYGTSYAEFGKECPIGFVCSRDIQNPNDGGRWNSFDNVFLTMFTIFQCTTLEGWPIIMQATQEAKASWSWVYFVVLIFIFSMMIINLFVATIRASFSKARSEERQQEALQNQQIEGCAKSECHTPISIQMNPIINHQPQGYIQVFKRNDLDCGAVITSSEELEKYVECIVEWKGVKDVSGLRLAAQKTMEETDCFTCARLARWLEAELGPASAGLEEQAGEKRQRTECEIAADCQKRFWNAMCCLEFDKWPCSAELISQYWFDPAILSIITLNSVFLCLPHANQSDDWEHMLKISEYIFMAIFALECMIRVTGMGGLRPYLSHPFNIFDFFLVLSSCMTELINLSGLRSLRTFRVLRMLRAMRGLRLLRVLMRLNRFYDVFAGSGTAIATQIFFIWYVLSIFSVVGMQLFDQSDLDNKPLGRQNFDTFANAQLTLFQVHEQHLSAELMQLHQVLTGEDWQILFVQSAKIDKLFAVPFFVCFIVFVNWALTEMLVAVIVEKFEISEEQRIKLQQDITRIRSSNHVESGEDETALQIAEHMVEEDGSSVSSTKALDVFAIEQCRVNFEKNSVGNSVPGFILKRWMAEHGFRANECALYFYQFVLAYRLTVADVSQHVLKSLNIFSRASCIRRFCRDIANRNEFETFIFVVILASCAFLALDTPNEKYKLSHVDGILEIADPTLLGLFTFEFIVKVIANGFYGKPNAYLSSTMNQFDFVCLALTALAFILKEIGGVGRLIRVFRCIRPLRMVTKVKSLKVVLVSTISILPQVGNIVFLYAFLALLYATVGLTLFMGVYDACNAPVEDQDNCRGVFMHTYSPSQLTSPEHLDSILDVTYPIPTVWVAPAENFDNIFEALKALLEVSSTEGWVNVMFNAMDIDGEHKQPRQNASWSNAFYFITFLVVIRLVIFACVVGVVIDQFNTTSGKGMLTEKQRNFQAIFTEPKPQRVVPPSGCPGLRWVCYKAVAWKHWESCMAMLILLNGVVLALPYHGMSSEYEDALVIVNNVLAGLFFLELTMRIIAYGVSQFFNNAYNRFDSCVVVAMCAASLLTGVFNVELPSVGILRLLLLTRLSNHHAHSLRTILVTLIRSILPLSAVLSMILLVFFIYAILGMSFFANVRHGEYLTDHFNFETFDRALITLLMMTTGEGWNGLMQDCSISQPDCTMDDVTLADGSVRSGDCGVPVFAKMYFTSFYFVGSFFLMSLFVAVISDIFQTCNAMRSFGIERHLFDAYGQLWLETTEHSKPQYKWLHTYQLKQFLAKLPAPFTRTEHREVEHIYNQVMYLAGTQTVLPNGNTTMSISFQRLVREDDLVRVQALTKLRRMAAWRRGKHLRAAFELHKKESSTGRAVNFESFWQMVHDSEGIPMQIAKKERQQRDREELFNSRKEIRLVVASPCRHR